MPLNLHGSSGDFVPFLKYNAKAGRWYVREENKPTETEIVSPTLSFDFARIKTGWIYYAEGQGPEKVFDPSLTVAAEVPKDGKKWKRGFVVTVHGPHPLGEREFSSTAGSVVEAINLCYAIYERDGAAHPGQMPTFRCSQVRAITGRNGTNYAPVFELVGWTPLQQSMDRSSLGQSPPQAPAAPAWAANNQQQAAALCAPGLTVQQAWAAYKASRPPGSSEADMKASYLFACKAYFGESFDYKRVTPEKWKQFVDDGFALASLPPAGTVMNERDIPF
jgi:hypothetical protein